MSPKKKGNELAKWEKEMEEEAKVAAAMEEGTATGNMFSTKSGELSFEGAPLPNNEMAVVIVGSILENVYYEGRYDPENPSGPACYAYGRNVKEMAPHKNIKDSAQADVCDGCPQNEWGSADQGRGKACRNIRRLAVISAGTLDERTGEFKQETDKDHFESTQMAFLKLPVTSVKPYAAMVKQLQGSMGRPPHGVFAKIKVVPDSKTQFKVVCEPLDKVSADLWPTIKKRHEEAQNLIEFPYPDMGDAEPQKGKAKGKPKKKAKATKKAAPTRRKF